ncbi:MAG: ribulose-phosphate 3-epimerase [Elusimicrobia bacterium]|nr:ribulose-phosphate 3-epimerase [Elusimicrobiota bacterium]
MRVAIAPSLLSADFSDLKADIKKCENAGIKILHVDVMDGHFVPNITIGPVVVESLRKSTDMILDTHLMISNPENYIELFANAGSDWITFHIEAAKKPLEIIRKIKKHKLKAGISINPSTPVSKIKKYLNEVDLVLVMSVNPGFGGQKFMPEALPKISELKKQRSAGRRKYKIEVDGGINFSTIGDVVKAGVDIVVAGNSVFKSEYGIKNSIKKMNKVANVF